MLTCTHVRHRWNSNHQRHWAFSAAPGRFPPRAMFWSMRYATTSSIDTILEREGGFTLEELLEEDELLQECKSQNTKLLEFLCEPASLTKMITYIVTMPEESDTEARRYKYPYVSSEVLSCDLTALRDAIFVASSGLVEQVLSILQQPPPLAPVLAGYCSKVMVALFKAAPEAFSQFFTDHWAAQPDSLISLSKIMPRLLLHIGSDAIMQMLLALCVGEPPALEPGMPPQPPQPNPSGSWIPYSMLVPALLGNVACEDAEAAQNSAQLLCTLLAATQALPPCLHETPVEGRENCKRLVASCLGEAGTAVNMPALEVTLQLLERCREGSEAAECAACRSALLDAVAERIDNFFVALVATPTLPARILRFVGTESKAALPRPMGQQRCKLLMLFEEAIRTEHPAICLALEQLGFFSVVLDMLLLPHQCNALHMRSASIVDHVLSLGAERTSPLLLALVQQADLATRLLAVVAPDGAQATPTGGEEGAAPPHLKPCCHAFAMTLAGSLLATAERQPRIAEVLEENAGWAAFTAASGPLAAWEAAQSKPLGGRAPTRQSDMDNESDDEVEFDSNDVQRALAAAQMARSGDNDDDDDTDNDRSSQYLAHFAQYLSQRNFVDDVSEDLNSLQDDQPPPAQSEWAADFDSGFDSAFEQSASANDASSAPAETFGAEPFGAGGAPPAPTAFDADFDAAFDDAPATASSTAGRPGEEDGDLGV
eukprot:Transcript_25111.p1 GENE.Transcript_25111~~Transcript_25111.p1  ORF type:complete len:714 (+),score=257.10 Transcript_25111:220-2361(+)